MTPGEIEDQLRIKGDNYKQTVLAIRALANEILFNDNAPKDEKVKCFTNGHIHIGRRMTTSAQNRRSPNNDVTPDLVIRHPHNGGVIAEAKLSITKNPEYFSRNIKATLEQLEAYDDLLTGWHIPPKNCDGVLECHDLILLVQDEDARRIAKEVQAITATEEIQFNNKMAIVGFTRTIRTDGEWPKLELRHGTLSDARKQEKLEETLPIRPEILDASPVVQLVELYDDEPPMPIMMDLVHKAISSNLDTDAGDYDQLNLEGEVRKEVTVATVRRWASEWTFKRVDTRDPEIPKKQWVESAFEHFVEMGWAEKVQSKRNTFVYIISKRKHSYSNPYGRFVKFCAKREAKIIKKKARAKEREKKKEERRKEREKKKEEARLAKDMEKHPLFAETLAKTTGKRSKRPAAGEGKNR